MAKKFDTNPLDPDFPERARAQKAPDTSGVRGYTAPTKTPYSTAEIPTRPHSVTEDETRRFEDSDFQAYSFSAGPIQTAYAAPQHLASTAKASERKVANTGIAEKWLISLPYLPFSIGLVAGLVLLFLLPKEENKVRFHAAQGLAAHVGILIVTTILGIVGNLVPFADAGSSIFTLVANVFLIIFAFKAWQGKPVHIESVDGLTNWLEEKIGPLKS
ncbi:MAG TPA: hypothetical protein VK918_02910 [Pyrinomonadaceae bacterium]|nr:hypothetical protein [Pyrinomonadaceae bacterium]